MEGVGARTHGQADLAINLIARSRRGLCDAGIEVMEGNYDVVTVPRIAALWRSVSFSRV